MPAYSTTFAPVPAPRSGRRPALEREAQPLEPAVGATGRRRPL